MSVFDVDKIINGTPEKRLLNGYNKLKQEYTTENAQEYSELYKNQPLSFLLANSRQIFSETYHGTEFYKNAVTVENCCFTEIERELDKVDRFISENGDSMVPEQKEVYTKLSDTMKSILEHTKNTRLYAKYIKENIDDTFEEKLSDILFEYAKSEDKDNSELSTFIESINNPIIFLTYAPYVEGKVDSTVFNKKSLSLLELCAVPSEYDEEQWKTYVEAVLCANKLSCDDTYVESVRHIPNRNVRLVYEYFMNTKLDTKLTELVEERVNENDVHFSSPVSAINNIFLDIMEATVNADENNEHKEQIERYKGIVYESVLDILVYDYQNSNDTTSKAEGYTLLKESEDDSLDSLFTKVNQLYQESAVFVTQEAEETQPDEDEEDNSNDDIPDDRTDGGNSGKKPKAPKPKNLANKIQFKAMDAEAKQQKRQAVRAQKGQEIANAAKAVTNLPMNVVTSIKKVTKSLDEADDERRKNFMTEPGFRKKIWRNLKLAILYGSAAQAKLAYVPVVMLCRNFSKQKDQRIRNELVREIETEIKVCEEKINDANANGDQKEKYRLIRIKDQLDAELVRVKTNSKYV